MVKPNISLSALIEADGVTLRGRPDGERCGACPRCGGRDRFHVRWYGAREWWFCRQCHPRRGDAIDYLRWAHGMTYREACAVLGQPTSRPAGQTRRRPATTGRGVVIPDVLDEAPPAEWQAAMSALVNRCAANIPAPVRRYLREERGLTDDTIRAHKLGYNPTPHKVAGRWWVERGITIPTAYAGSLWRVNVRRRADDLRDGRGKYIAAQGSKAQLFNGDALGSDAGEAVSMGKSFSAIFLRNFEVQAPHSVLVCAGEFDTMLAQQCAPSGVACVTFGSESKRPTWEFDYLTRDKRVIVAFDNDHAGEQYRQAWRSLGEQVRVPAGKDITEFWQRGGDLAGWLAGLTARIASARIASAQAGDSEFESAVLAWLEAKGYEPRYSPTGSILAARPEVEVNA